ncbi:MAG: AAA family ATPase [Marmoricola sp.]
MIDEATLAGTLTLDRITAHADQAGAKVLLIGDWAQLQSVEAGGAFGMLVEASDDAPELVDIHRFTNEWEKIASLDLRHGRAEIIDTYIDHGRVDDGDGRVHDRHRVRRLEARHRRRASQHPDRRQRRDGRRPQRPRPSRAHRQWRRTARASP